MENYVFDTNLFFNMEAGFGLGEKTETVVRSFTKIAINLKEKKVAEFFTSPRVADEFLSFFKNKKQLFIKEFLSVVTIKSPQIANVNLSAAIFYQLIREVKERNKRALKIGEEQLKQLGEAFLKKEISTRRDLAEKSGLIVKNYRQRFRNATRAGFIDSLADFDLILLAKELGAYLITSDEGVIRWGRLFGVREVPAETLSSRLQLLLRYHQGQD